MNKQKANWTVDAVLFASFLACFLLDLTGLSLHQWLGAAVAVLAGYHLLRHRAWVGSVTVRLFKSTSGQALVFYMVDATLMLGLFTVLVTGLAISTWSPFPVSNYPAWGNLHLGASIVSLLVLVLKIGLHWRWIVTVAQRSLFIRTAATGTAHPLKPTPAPRTMDRSAFLRLMGIVGAGAAIAIGSSLDGLTDALTKPPILEGSSAASLSQGSPQITPTSRASTDSEASTHVLYAALNGVRTRGVAPAM